MLVVDRVQRLQGEPRHGGDLGVLRAVQLDLLERPAGVVQGLLTRPFHLWVEVGPERLADDADAQRALVAHRQLAPRERLAQEPRVGGVAAHRAGGVHARELVGVALERHHAESALEARDPAVGRGEPDRAAAVDAHGPGHEPRTHRGGGSA